MQMGMKKQSLTPTVEYSKKADLGTQVLGIGSDGGQGLGGGTEENVVDGPLVLQGDVGNLFRHCKDNVKIGNVEKLGLSVLNPLGARQGLAFGTVTIGACNGDLSITCFMGSISLWGVHCGKPSFS